MVGTAVSRVWTDVAVVRNSRYRPAKLSTTLGVALMSLTACGGNSSMTASGGGTPTGYAYVASAAASNSQTQGAVFQYSIASDGLLTALSTASVPTGVNPAAMTADPTGHYLYAFNQGDNTISQYSVGVGGSLAALSPAIISVQGPFPSAAGSSLSVDPSGHALYLIVTPRDLPGVASPLAVTTSILQYAIGSDGRLSPLSPASISVGAVGAGPLTFNPSGTYAYLAVATTIGSVASVNGAVLQFSLGSVGELTPILSQSVTATHNAFAVTIGQSGRTAYVLSSCIDNACDGEIAEYSVGASGALTPTGATVATGSHVIPISLLTDTSESSAYLLTNLMGVDTNQGAVYQYTIDNAGGLTPITPPAVAVASGAVSQSVFGPNLYALSSNALGFASGAPAGGHIDQYTIGAGGVLTAVSRIDVAGGCTAMMGACTGVVGSSPTAMTLVATH